MQGQRTIRISTFAAILSFVMLAAVAPRAGAQESVYYTPTDASSPAATTSYAAPNYYSVPSTVNAGASYYTPQYYQPTNDTQVAQATYAPQYYQTAQAAQPSTDYYATATTGYSQGATGGDPYGFTSWLNSLRASYGLGQVSYDPNLASWAAMNNQQQSARGIGHFVMGPARRQNSAMGGFPGIESMWMASPAHRAALLDPTITAIGIAGAGAWWTFNAN